MSNNSSAPPNSSETDERGAHASRASDVSAICVRRDSRGAGQCVRHSSADVDKLDGPDPSPAQIDKSELDNSAPCFQIRALGRPAEIGGRVQYRVTKLRSFLEPVQRAPPAPPFLRGGECPAITSVVALRQSQLHPDGVWRYPNGDSKACFESSLCSALSRRISRFAQQGLTIGDRGTGTRDRKTVERRRMSPPLPFSPSPPLPTPSCRRVCPRVSRRMHPRDHPAAAGLAKSGSTTFAPVSEASVSDSSRPECSNVSN